MRNRIFAGIVALSAGFAVGQEPKAAPPMLPVTVKAENGPKPGAVTYRVALDRAAAEKLRDALADADIKRVGEVLSSATDDPAQKVAVALATTNADAFRRRMAEDGAIGPNGSEIVMTAHPGANEAAPLLPGRVDRTPPGPLRQKLRAAARRAGEIALNPWSWEVKPRE